MPQMFGVMPRDRIVKALEDVLNYPGVREHVEKLAINMLKNGFKIPSSEVVIDILTGLGAGTETEMSLCDADNLNHIAVALGKLAQLSLVKERM